MIRKITLTTFIVALTCLVTACDDGGGGSDARVRLFNAAVGQTAINLAVDGSPLTTQNYSEISDYQDIDEGTRQITGIAIPSNQQLFSFSSRFDNDIDYTVVAVKSATGVDPVLFVDENNRPDVGNFRIHSINAAPSAGPVDIYVLRENVPLAGQHPTFSNVGFTQESGYQQIDRNEYVVWVTRAGTQEVLASQTTDFDNFEVWTAAVIDGPTGGVAVRLIRDRN